MSTPLAELTLKYSRDLSTLLERCRRRLRGAEDDRIAALDQVPEAKKPRTTYLAAVAKAARTKRETDDKVQRTYRDSTRASSATQREELRVAERAYKEELRRITRELPLSKQSAARTKARAAKAKAARAADKKYRDATRAARTMMQTGMRDADAQERPALRAARSNADIDRKAASRNHQIDVNAVARALKQALAGIPAAAAVEERFKRRKQQITTECQDREKALWEKFKKDSRALKNG